MKIYWVLIALLIIIFIFSFGNESETVHAILLEFMKSESIVSSIISIFAALIGIIGAYIVANYQLRKTLAYSNPQYNYRFNMAQINIDDFILISEEIIDILTTPKRKDARVTLSSNDFEELRKIIINSIMTINPCYNAEDIEGRFDEIFSEINKDAPILYYKQLNGLIYGMIVIYDNLIDEAKYLFEDLPKPILPRLKIINNTGVNHGKVLKYFIKRYKWLKKKIKLNI